MSDGIRSPIPHGHYARLIRDRLPPEAFAAAPQKLWQIALHLAVLIGLYVVIGAISNTVLHVILAVVIGHSLACLAFLAHELSHGVIIRARKKRYPLELLLWGLNAVPTTLWDRIHNHSHHSHAATTRDPDRFFLKSELESSDSRWRRLYVKYFYPHRSTRMWNPLVWSHFLTYVVRHVSAVFYRGVKKPSIVTFKPTYTRRQRIRIMLELGSMVLIQIGIYLAVGRNLEAFLWASPVALVVCSSIVMSYVWTNHYLHGIQETYDPVGSSTSVQVLPVFDRLHNNFSCHTEHHIFPCMSGEFYPLISAILREEYPDRYHQIPIREAWALLFTGDAFAQEIGLASQA